MRRTFRPQGGDSSLCLGSRGAGMIMTCDHTMGARRCHRLVNTVGISCDAQSRKTESCKWYVPGADALVRLRKE